MLESAAICLYLAREFSSRVNLLPNAEQLPVYLKYVTRRSQKMIKINCRKIVLLIWLLCFFLLQFCVICNQHIWSSIRAPIHAVDTHSRQPTRQESCGNQDEAVSHLRRHPLFSPPEPLVCVWCQFHRCRLRHRVQCVVGISHTTRCLAGRLPSLTSIPWSCDVSPSLSENI